MKAVLFGSIAHENSKGSQDLDILIDSTNNLGLSDKEKIIGDFGTTYVDHASGPFKIEYTIPNPGTAFEMVLNKNGIENKITKINQYDQLCLLKAHLILPGSNHQKWLRQIEFFNNLKISYFEEEIKPIGGEVFDLHRKESLARAKKHPKLNQSKDEFFGKESYDIFDHDSLHEVVAIGDYPMYTRYLKSEVGVDKKAWDKLFFSEQIWAAIEEVSVLSLERSLIPFIYLSDRNYRGDVKTFEFALYKVCTTITSGWFRDFCIDNYFSIVKEYNRLKEAKCGFRDKFFKALKKDSIKVNNKELVYGKSVEQC